MGLFIKLAIRNVQRYARSSILNGTGISLCTIVILFIFSLSRGIETQIISRNIKFETGAISIDFEKKTASLQHKTKGDSIFKSIITQLDNNEEIKNYFFRIYPSNSLLYFEENSQRVNITGISENENQLINEMLKITEGNSDLRNNEKTILISSGLAELLNLKIENECNLMLQSLDGTINLDNFKIIGIFRYTSQMNKFAVYMNYDQAKEIYYCNLPSKILITLNQLDQANRIKQDLANQLKCQCQEEGKESKCNGYSISSYKDHSGMAKTLSGFNKYGMSSIAFFLILISFVGIWSMQVENINERKREIGSLLSFGFSRFSIKKIFLYESIITSITFFTIGFLIVLTCIFLINKQNGIYLGDSASFAFGSAIVNPILSATDVIVSFIIVLVYPLVATIISLNTINNVNIIHLLKN